MVIDGAQMFVRYAYPPNSRGSCGPPDSDALLHYGQSGVTDQGLRELAKGFAGAFPYLELIAGAHGIPDPLDARVVEAYWVGNSLLDTVGISTMGNSMEDRFRARTGRQFPHLVEGVLAGGVPHHSFHVFEIYPWLGLLRDDRRYATALNVLDRCRIRWGKVLAVEEEFEPRYLKERAVRISIFLNVFDVHINRIPCEGLIEDVQYQPGLFLVASKPQATLKNEQNALMIKTVEGAKVLCVQVAGLIARRIVWWVNPKDRAVRGERYGLIRFGSRMDTYLPAGTAIKIAVGDRVKGGETILGVLP